MVNTKKRGGCVTGGAGSAEAMAIGEPGDSKAREIKARNGGDDWAEGKTDVLDEEESKK